jgi:hypothetical protein
MIPKGDNRLPDRILLSLRRARDAREGLFSFVRGSA